MASREQQLNSLLEELRALPPEAPLPSGLRERFVAHFGHHPESVDEVTSQIAFLEILHGEPSEPMEDDEFDRIWGKIRRQAAIDEELETDAPKAMETKRRRWVAGAAGVAAACFLAAVWLWPRPSSAHVTFELTTLDAPELNPVPFPGERPAYQHGSRIAMSSTPNKAQYVYILEFDDRGSAVLNPRSAHQSEASEWILDGKRMDTMIVLATAREFSDSEKRAFLDGINRAAQRGGMSSGTKFDWSPDGISVRTVTKMGTSPPTDIPSWANMVKDILDSTKIVEHFSGVSLPIE